MQYFKSFFRRSAVYMLIFSLFAHSAFGSTENRTSEFRLDRQYIDNFGVDIVSVFTSPSRWRTKDWLAFSAVMGLGLLIFEQDDDMRGLTQNHNSPMSRSFARKITHLGDPVFMAVLVSGLYAGGELFDHDGWRKTSLLSLESLASSLIIAYGLKIMTGRPRPYMERDDESFRPFSLDPDFHSFPSGHAAAAFSVAAVIASESRDFLVGALSYGLASMVAISRISLDKHWASDVFAGAAIGWLVGRKIISLDRRRQADSWSIGFNITPRNQALTIAFSF